jgi:hypothetical protein
MKKNGLIILVILVSVLVNWLALLGGWWWLTPIIGLFIGLTLRPIGMGILVSLCAGGLGWGLPLAILAIHTPVKSIANAVESVSALPATGGIAIIGLTVALGCVLSVVSSWVGTTSRNCFAKNQAERQQT